MRKAKYDEKQKEESKANIKSIVETLLAIVIFTLFVLFSNPFISVGR